MARREWEQLSSAYRARLTRAGITSDVYNAGGSLKAARGHATTPERPERAFRHPDLYSEYLRRRVAKGGSVPRDILPPSAVGKPRMISDAIGWPGRESLDKWIFTRSSGGGGRGELGTMTHIRYDPRTGEQSMIASRSYAQQDFVKLSREAKERGFAVQVVSVPSMGVTA